MFFAFSLANGNTMLTWITWNSKDPIYLMGTVNATLFHVKQVKRVWPRVEIASLLCADRIFLVRILFQGHDSLNCPHPVQAGTRTYWIWRLCVLWRRVWAGGCVWLRVQKDTGGIPAWATALCPHWESWLVSSGHHRTVPFNLKSAGFKALCWQ